MAVTERQVLAALMTGLDLPDRPEDGLRPPWMADALCIEYPDVDFVPATPAAEANADDARGICSRCLCRGECRAYAMADPELSGVWGGLTTAQRRTARAALADALDAPKPASVPRARRADADAVRVTLDSPKRWGREPLGGPGAPERRTFSDGGGLHHICTTRNGETRSIRVNQGQARTPSDLHVCRKPQVTKEQSATFATWKSAVRIRSPPPRLTCGYSPRSAERGSGRATPVPLSLENRASRCLAMSRSVDSGTWAYSSMLSLAVA